MPEGVWWPRVHRISDEAKDEEPDVLKHQGIHKRLWWFRFRSFPDDQKPPPLVERRAEELLESGQDEGWLRDHEYRIISESLEENPSHRSYEQRTSWLISTRRRRVR